MTDEREYWRSVVVGWIDKQQPIYAGELLDELADLRAQLAKANERIEVLEAERDSFKYRVDSYACELCGGVDGLDAVAANNVWGQLSAAANGARILCLWCMDKLAEQNGISGSVTLHFAGRALYGTSHSDADQDHARRLGERIEALEAKQMEAAK